MPANARQTVLTSTPSRVDFGAVPVDADCRVINSVPTSGCATAVVTVTNPTSEPVHIYSVGACVQVKFHFGRVTCEGGNEGRSWGGFLENSTCLTPVLLPGESCEITLVGHTEKKGGINGYLLITTDEGTEIALLLPVKIRGT